MLIRQIVDDKLAQYAFLVGCQQTGEAIVVDPERDVDRYIDLAAHEGLRLVAVAETHIHADFLSGARELASRIPGLRVYLSDEGDETWKYSWPRADGAHVIWLTAGTMFKIGNIEFRTVHTPGHTPEHIAFLVTDSGGGATEPMGFLSGDFVFAGDLGRPDLLESAAGVAGAMDPAARRLFASTKKFLELPDFLQVWPAHGAGSACGKALGAVPVTTVGYERRMSPAIAASREGEQEFVDYILSNQPEPPLYFTRMKHLNKVGPPVLRKLPQPKRMDPGEIRNTARNEHTQILDTRADRRSFFARHVPGSFYAPINKAFPTVVGSLLDAERDVVLLVEEARLEEAIRAMIRIGYDRIPGWAPPSVIDELHAAGMQLSHIESIGFDELERRRSRQPLAVLDVRGASEYAAGHIPEAQNISHTRLRARANEVPRDRPVYVHCLSGSRAAASVAFLAHIGVPVVDVDGNFSSWEPLALEQQG